MQSASHAPQTGPRIDLRAKDSAKAVYSLEGFKSVLLKDLSRWKNKTLERFHEVVILLCLTYLILQVFSLTTLFTFACLGWSTKALVMKKLDTLLERGLANYLPQGLRNALLNRSLLDMLCDLWFIPTISLYLKTILAPIISSKKRDPEEAVKYLEPLEPHHRRIFITKGLAFLFPKKITKILLPKDYFASQPLTKTGIKKGSFLSDIDESDDESHRTGLPPLPLLVPATSLVKKAPASPLRLMPSSTAEGSSDTQTGSQPHKHLAEFQEQSESLAPVVTEPHAEEPQLVESTSRAAADKPQPFSGMGKAQKSKVLMSSKLLRLMKDMPGRIDPSWDNINEYRRRANLGIKKTASSDKLDVLQLLMDLKRLEFLKKVNMGMAARVTGGATVSLFTLLYFFKRTRNWMKNFGLLCLFTVTLIALGSGVTMGLTAYKTKRVDKQERKQLEDEAEAAAQARDWETQMDGQRTLQRADSLDMIAEESSN